MPNDAEPKRRALLEDSDSDQEEGGARVEASEFIVNDEFAKRFEHNKRREEIKKLEEKYGDEDSSESSSSSDDETEDEDGFLATEQLDTQISATLQAIRSKDPRIYDKSVTFIRDEDVEAAGPREKTEKPVHLQDYHRDKLLRGDIGASDDGEDPPENPATFSQEQDALKKSILSEIQAADEEGSNDDYDNDGFLKRKDGKRPTPNGTGKAKTSMPQITEDDVANADKDPELYLSNFMAARAWVPLEGTNWKPFDSDEEDSNEEERAEEFEFAYNMRFEDPEKSNEVLKTFARDVAAQRSVRRDKVSGRKKQRELEKGRKADEKKERQEERARLRKLKVEEAEQKLRKIKRVAGMSGKEVEDDEWTKFLEDEWDNEKWEEEMRKRFGEQYYAQGEGADDSGDEDAETGNSNSTKLKKPEWDDDIDIRDIIPDFEDTDVQPNITLTDSEQESEDDESVRPRKKTKTSKDRKKERLDAKRAAKKQRAKLEAFVDTQMDLNEPAVLAAASGSKPSAARAAPFRYRATSPTSFGMTARDILLAPSDAALNEFAGLKRLATFRDEDKKRRDRKRFHKGHHLRMWRREVFGSQFEKSGPTFGFEQVLVDEAEGAAGGSGARETDKKRYEKKEKETVKDKGGDEVEAAPAAEEKKRKRKRSKGKHAAGGDGVSAPVAEVA